MGLRVLKIVFRYGLIVSGISMFLPACKTKPHEVPYYHTADFTPLWLSKASDTLHTIAGFQFTDQDGKQVSNETYKGKIYVANFFFTHCPSICPKMTKHMHMLADSFKANDKVGFISYSVTPDIDSVQQLQKYAQQYGIDSKHWHLVTGDKAQIYSLARKSYFAEEEIGLNADSSEFLHTEHFLLIDADKHIRGVYNGTVFLEMQRLKEDIDKLLRE